jgi:hypothetical protein
MYRSTLKLVGPAVLAIGCAHASAATVYLTGALIYDANATGQVINSNLFEYDTFSATAPINMVLNGIGSDPVIALSTGVNNLTIRTAAGATPFFGLGLFLSQTNTVFPGPNGSAANLYVVDSTAASTSFSVVGNGVGVGTYGNLGGDAIYNGASSFTTGQFTITVTGLDFVATGSITDATLQLTVVDNSPPSPIPLPASSTMALAAGSGTILRRRRA